jgi:DNA-binding NarL/FixJ family response regulator
MPGEIRVLLVDDQEIIRQGLRHVLEREEDMVVVGDCASAEEVFSQVDILSPDVILMDGQMPGTSGIEITRKLKRNGFSCDAGIVILADRMDDLIAAMEAGASGYLLKDTGHEQLAETVRQVYLNEHMLSDREGFVEEVELFVHRPLDAAQLMKFVRNLEETFHATVMQTVGSWEWGAIVTLSTRPAAFESFLETLESMSDVESIVDEGLTTGGPGFLKRFRALQRSRGKSGKGVMVTLKQADMAKQELAQSMS